uniref:Zona occludens toxin N-terminal domain-containing protein n=1 Tax=Leptocylindrus danicus TaxID=163516 RepID=A0A7S2LK38_9STRA
MKKKDNEEVKIAVHDSSADIITFQESLVKKKSAQTVAVDSIEEDEDSALLAAFESKISMTEKCEVLDEAALSIFGSNTTATGSLLKNKGLSLFSSANIGEHPEGSLFGHLLSGDRDGVYLNTHSPFCFVTVGVQGAGKSHTSSCVLESCLVPFAPGNVVKLNNPQTSMVLHYDQNITSICEAAGLLMPNPSVQKKMSSLGYNMSAVPKEKAVILVSPAFYKQRKKFYGDGLCTVRPLLFRWRSLTADHIKRIMRIESGDNQLYVASFLELLRGYQREALVPDFSSFLDQVREVCNAKGQMSPLQQRIALLESVVAESKTNAGLINESLDLITCTKDGYQLIIADLTDPLLSKDEANGLFQVLTEQFRTLPTKGGKCLFLDEAHKYMTGEKADGLSEAIVNVARLMRHDGVRLVVSTQSPKALAPELLELVTIAVLHHFHSPDWYTYLKSKLPLNDDAFERIISLNSGEAVAFATNHDLSVDHVEGSHCLPLRVRPRLTMDLGSSRRNT